jgi:hypothetical protein
VSDVDGLAFDLYAFDGLLLEHVVFDTRAFSDGDLSVIDVANRQATYCHEYLGYVRCVDLPSGDVLATLDPHGVVGGTTFDLEGLRALRQAMRGDL